MSNRGRLRRVGKKFRKNKDGPWPIALKGKERLEEIMAQTQREIMVAQNRHAARVEEVALAYRDMSGVPEEGDFPLDLDTFEYKAPGVPEEVEEADTVMAGEETEGGPDRAATKDEDGDGEPAAVEAEEEGEASDDE